MPQGSVLGPQLFLLYTAGLLYIAENTLCGYADYSTSVAVVPFPGERVAITEFLNCDLNRVSMWCNQLGMKLNASESKTMIVFRPHTIHLQLTPLSLDGTELKESADLVMLGLMFEAKMAF